jgi:hypothetical protein
MLAGSGLVLASCLTNIVWLAILGGAILATVGLAYWTTRLLSRQTSAVVVDISEP